MTLRVALLVALLVTLLSSISAVESKKYRSESERQRQWLEFEEFLEWKKSKELNEHGKRDEEVEAIAFSPGQRQNVDEPRRNDDDEQQREHQDGPPPVDQVVLMARYVVNQAVWSSVATISTRKDIESFPTVNVISFSDGPLGNGSGIPYLYLTPRDFTAQDLAKDYRASLLMSLAQGTYCTDQIWDPMDPRCARIILTGKIKALKNESAEHEIAKKAVFGRHPKLEGMPADHHFFFAKLKIAAIALLDTFGGPKYIGVKDYLHPPTANATEEFLRRYHREQQDPKPMSNFFEPIVRNV